MKNRNIIHKDDWETPDYLLKELEEEFGTMFDPCPINSNMDGLLVNWLSPAFVNPPYSRILKEKFIRKSYNESLKGKTIIMLLPVSTSTKIFHEVIYPNAEIRFIKGRVSFKGTNTKGEYVTNKKPMHDSMICIFRGLK